MKLYLRSTKVDIGLLTHSYNVIYVGDFNFNIDEEATRKGIEQTFDYYFEELGIPDINHPRWVDTWRAYRYAIIGPNGTCICARHMLSAIDFFKRKCTNYLIDANATLVPKSSHPSRHAEWLWSNPLNKMPDAVNALFNRYILYNPRYQVVPLKELLNFKARHLCSLKIGE